MWQEYYKIGIEQIDQQHKQLFLTTEALLKALRDEAGWDKKLAKDTIDFLKSYIKVHFSTEELHQKNIGFAEGEAHKKMHRELMDAVHEYDLALMRCDYDMATARRLAGMMTSWLVYHVMREDRKMAFQRVAGSAREQAVLEAFAKSARETLEGMHLAAEATAGGGMQPNPGDLLMVVRLAGAFCGQAVFALAPAAAAGMVEHMAVMALPGMEDTINAAHLEMAANVCRSALEDLARQGVECTAEPPQLAEAGGQPPRGQGVALNTDVGSIRVILLQN